MLTFSTQTYMSIIKYQGYAISIDYDPDLEALVGQLLYINDDISFVIGDPANAKKMASKAVDEYLANCQKRGIVANKPFSGSFTVRTTPAKHHKMAVAATEAGLSLNKWIDQITAMHVPV